MAQSDTTMNLKSSNMMPEIQILLEKITSQAKKEKVAKIESGVELNPKEEKAIGAFLERLIGHPVALRCHVNPHVLGGLKIQVGDWVVDTTLSNQLHQLSEVLLSA